MMLLKSVNSNVICKTFGVSVIIVTIHLRVRSNIAEFRFFTTTTEKTTIN